jgi:hypothetical protein
MGRAMLTRLDLLNGIAGLWRRDHFPKLLQSQCDLLKYVPDVLLRKMRAPGR